MIYLVDDDIDDIEMVQDAFERCDFKGEIAYAKNGQDFIEQIHRSKLPELIVMDLNMPLKDGFEVLKDLKKSRDLSIVPVVILTASHNQQDEIKCTELGCALFLRKPSTLDGYNAIVMSILNVLRHYKSEDSAPIGTPEGRR